MNFLHKIKMKFKQPKEVERLEINSNCIGCGKCVTMCKRNVFVMEQKKATVANLAACMGCGKCLEKMCKFGAINLVLSKN